MSELHNPFVVGAKVFSVRFNSFDGDIMSASEQTIAKVHKNGNVVLQCDVDAGKKRQYRPFHFAHGGWSAKELGLGRYDQLGRTLFMYEDYAPIVADRTARKVQEQALAVIKNRVGQLRVPRKTKNREGFGAALAELEAVVTKIEKELADG